MSSSPCGWVHDSLRLSTGQPFAHDHDPIQPLDDVGRDRWRILQAVIRVVGARDVVVYTIPYAASCDVFSSLSLVVLRCQTFRRLVTHCGVPDVSVQLTVEILQNGANTMAAAGSEQWSNHNIQRPS